MVTYYGVREKKEESELYEIRKRAVEPLVGGANCHVKLKLKGMSVISDYNLRLNIRDNF